MKKTINPSVSGNLFGIDRMEGTYWIGKHAYPLSDAVKASVVLEDEAFAGKGTCFTHLVLADTMQPVQLHTKYVYFGIRITMRDGKHRSGYLYTDPVQINTLLFYERKKEAEKMVNGIDAILK